MEEKNTNINRYLSSKKNIFFDSIYYKLSSQPHRPQNRPDEGNQIRI